MAINKKPTPVQTSKRKMATTLMDHQDTKARGDSTATRTKRITFSTTDEIAKALEDAAYEQRISRSRLIEQALCEYLGSS